jgi:hypothetical protein
MNALDGVADAMGIVDGIVDSMFGEVVEEAFPAASHSRRHIVASPLSHQYQSSLSVDLIDVPPSCHI